MVWKCKKCGLEAKKVILDSYEYEKGIPLNDVEALQCPKCKEFFFSEKQLEEIERRTEAIKFLIYELVRYINLEITKEEVIITPRTKGEFSVKVVSS